MLSQLQLQLVQNIAAHLSKVTVNRSLPALLCELVPIE